MASSDVESNLNLRNGCPDTSRVDTLSKGRGASTKSRHKSDFRTTFVGSHAATQYMMGVCEANV